jgi:glycosyltransferase involved in cell wall biosynthesis
MPARHTLALVVIARDEAPRIQRLLRSVAPFVDAMHVLDTGSHDDTPSLAAACGAVMHHSAWPDDFAAARNTALAHAGADWHLVLDADEWLIDGGPALAALRNQAPVFVGALQLQDQLADGAGANSWLSRVFPGALRYAGRVHEQVPHRLPVQRLPVQIGHDGYLPERLAAKQGRNRALLQQALAEQPARPNQAYLWYQLGKDCGVYDEHAAAEAALAQAMALADPAAPWWPDAVVRRLFALKQLQRHAEGMDLAEAARARCAELPDFFFALGDLLLDLAAGQPQHAAVLLPMIEAAWRRCLALGERPDLPATVPGRGSSLAAFNLALVLEGTGRAAEARALREQHPVPAAV